MYVFVYGTLKKGFENEHFLSSAKFIGKGITKSKFPMVSIIKAYPYVINDEGYGHNIQGEVYEIDDKILKRLDALEGYPEHYDRKSTMIDVDSNLYKTIIYFIKKKIEYKNLELLKVFEKEEFYYFD